eukprot:scaffold76248_cov45-Phaeocystis_antarctica.AAC.3
MPCMDATLDVSQLSGWLNADAAYRESKKGQAVRGEGSGRSAHSEHAAHGCDAGGVEAQRLVELKRAIEHAVYGCDAGGVEAQRLVERMRAREHVGHICHARVVEDQRLVERLRAVEHGLHVYDAGCVPAQPLVEHRRAGKHRLHGCDAGDVSKLSGWLNALVLLNMRSMVVTFDVSQLSD